MRLPVAVLTGFLGSGKTTLLGRLLRDPALHDTAVLVNELGEIGLDHHLLQPLDRDLVLLKSGCVCCTIRGDLRDALADLWDRRATGRVPPFARIVVETTGLADPTPILATLLHDPAVRDHVAVGAVIATVDAVHGLATLDAHPEAVKQAAVADRLVLTKTDLAPASAVAALAGRLERLNPSAPRVAAADTAAELLLGEPRPALAAGPADLGAHHDHRHGDIGAVTLRLDQAVDWTAFGIWLSLLLSARGDEILRVKGLLDLGAGRPPVAIHGVQQLVHPPVHLAAWPEGARGSYLVFIGRGLEAERLRRSLDAFGGIARAD